MSSFKNGVLPCPFGECGGVCEEVDVEYDDGEDGGEDEDGENGGGIGGLLPFPPSLFKVFLCFLHFLLEDLRSHLATLNLSPHKELSPSQSFQKIIL